MKRVNLSISDEDYEALRKLAYEERVQPGTLAAKMVVAVVSRRISEGAAGKVNP